MTLITIIGRGHSGTRAMSHTLSASGVFMGSPLNVSGDLLPPKDMYDACRVLAKYVTWQGDMKWDWSRLFNEEIDPEFTRLIHSYLTSVMTSPVEHRGWKIPETTLAFPWINRLFPDIKYIFWIRDPRDCIIGRHLTDDLNDFGIHYAPTEDIRLRRAISWKYQYDLVRATPKPANWIEVRFEDFVLKQEETLKRLEEFLGIPLVRIQVRPDSIGRWKEDDGTHYYDFFEPAMKEYGYEIEEKSTAAQAAAKAPEKDPQPPSPSPTSGRRRETGGKKAMKVCIIGMGPIGNRHADMYRLTPLADLAGVCDIIPERAEAASTRLGVPSFLDAQDMLDKIKPDLVSICTAGVENGGDHFIPAMQALEAGCNVLCEKPISNEIPKAEAMVAKAREKGVYLGANLNHRFNPAHRMAKTWVEEGRLGHLLFVNMSMWIGNPSGKFAVLPDSSPAPAYRGYHALLLR